jgi:ferredoxin
MQDRRKPLLSANYCKGCRRCIASCPHPNVLIAFNAPSLLKFGVDVCDGGPVLFDSTVMPNPSPPVRAIQMFGIAFICCDPAE